MSLLIIFAGVLVAVVLAIFIIEKQRHGARQQLAKRRELARSLADDFKRIGWGAWGPAAHLSDEQATRMQRAADSTTMELLEYNPNIHTAVVRGERGSVYHIDERGCSCPDFRKRQLPCKHMYFAFLHILDLNTES